MAIRFQAAGRPAADQDDPGHVSLLAGADVVLRLDIDPGSKGGQQGLGSAALADYPQVTLRLRERAPAEIHVRHADRGGDAGRQELDLTARLGRLLEGFLVTPGAIPQRPMTFVAERGVALRGLHRL